MFCLSVFYGFLCFGWTFFSAQKDYCVMSFDCRSNALCKLLFVSKHTFQYAYHVTTCPVFDLCCVVMYIFFVVTGMTGGVYALHFFVFS